MSMGYYYRWLFLAFLVSCSLAAQVNVRATIDTSKMRIGEQARIDLYFEYDANKGTVAVQWPELSDTITKKIEIVSSTQIDTTLPDKRNPGIVLQHQQLLISIYDSGYYAIPPFKFILNSDTTKPLFTNPLFIEVHTVPTDTSSAKVKDIKPPLDEPFNWKWYISYIYWLVAALVIMIVITLIIIYFNRRKRAPAPVIQKPAVPAHITALASLEKIRSEKIWTEGKVKEYYSQISDAVRLYIEERFSVHALESTTDEIMTAFRSQVVDPQSLDKLRQLLTLSDLVKFAKLSPIESEHDFTLQNAFDFVNGTKREEVIELPEENVKPQP
jgi:hypothetical protein